MTEALSDAPQSPGSLRDFAASRGYEAADPRVFAEYSNVLAGYRQQLAEAQGITLEELHQGPPRKLGRIGLTTAINPSQSAA